ncbi:MAG: transcription-repair coupling factor [Bacilli bacterium]
MDILELLHQHPKINKVINQIASAKSHENIYIGNTCVNVSKMIASMVFKQTNSFVVYVCDDTFEASKAFEVFTDLLGNESVSFFPVEEFISTDLIASSSEFKLARMLTIYNILNNKPQLIVTNTDGILKNLMSKEKLQSAILEYHVGQVIEINQIVEELLIRGYKKTAVTDELGTFSVRGSIIDIYPINRDEPVRINFFDNEIDSIKTINLETQMSIKKIDSTSVFPLYEIYYQKKEINEIIQRIKKTYPMDDKTKRIVEKIPEYQNFEQLYIYLPQIDENYQNFLSIIPNAICFYENYNDLLSYEKKRNEEITEYLNNLNYKYDKKFFKSLIEVKDFAKNNIYTSSFLSSLNDINLHYLFDLKTSNVLEYNNNLKTMFDDIQMNEGRTYIITHLDENKLSYIEELLETRNLHYYILEDNDNKIKKGKINVGVSTNAYGFIDYEENLEVITPNEYAPSKISKNNKYQKYYKHTTKIYHKDELNPGDYVVHQDYGIGIYLGIKTLEIRGLKKDFLSLQYANDTKVNIPIENIYLLEKYIGSKNQTPKLNNLNSKDWAKKKAKIKEKVGDIAQKLIKVQAERELMKGYIYKPDSNEQLEFEHDFAFVETTDQLNAISDVKRDMEGPRPVDRLICGDVGFGKTEVALRATFKAIDNGKQVVYLAPTTVLTRQHYYTFKDRLEKYGIRVELLNRFVDRKKQKEIIDGLKSGIVDVVIGTHRLLSNEISYKNLGLLIIDEEQRFGVTHKEKIKQMKSLVDVLTLTATPIPRTLQLALSGLKDLSLIETPPVNRLPVQTYVLENNESVIREAINREIARGGQVFYLLNRINELDGILTKLRNLVPKAKIGMIHGKMDKEEIEMYLVNFLERKFDVLLCTTIIETGIDIPNANTLIVEKSDILGLSQLYQIRGRVGRSDRIAYAYFMYDTGKVLTSEAEKRLETIKEFTALGSGYKIAMRDLAIRGAGDILGSEQSGYIDAIGMDLYMKLLNDAINEIKGTTPPPANPRKFNIDISRHVSPTYVSDEEIRIEIHQSINQIKSRDQVNMLINEYTDRYGKLSDDILLYMEEKYLEHLLKTRHVDTFKEKEDSVLFGFEEEYSLQLTKRKYNFLFDHDFDCLKFEIIKNKIYVSCKTKPNNKSYIYILTKFLEQLDV